MRRALSICIVCHIGFVAVVFCLVAQARGVARAQGAPAPDSASTAAAALGATVPTPLHLTPSDWDALNLGRAVDLWSKGDIKGAAELLETIDISRGSPSPVADRAAFLLSAAYLALDDTDAFHRVAERAADETGSPYRRWVRYCQLVESHAVGGTADRDLPWPPDFPGADILGASLLMETGHPSDALRVLERATPKGRLASIHLYLQALAREAAGGDATREWERLADYKFQSDLEADLVATALIRLSITRIEAQADPSELLKRVPRQSRHAPRADHMLALLAERAGDTQAAAKLLNGILEDHPIYESRRDVELALGSLAMDNSDWSEALSHFESAESDWLHELESLTYFENPEALSTIWQAWEQRKLWRDEIRLAPEAIFADVARCADEALNLEHDPSLTPAKDLSEDLWPVTEQHIERAAWDRTDALARYYPRPEEWEALRSLQQQRRRAESTLANKERAVAEKKLDIARRLDYVGRGRDQASASADALQAAAARLDSILARLNAAVSQLEAARDSALLHIAVRTRDMTENIRRDLVFMQAMQHFYVDGPQRRRAGAFPEGVPSPGELLLQEEALAGEAEDFLTLFANHYPHVIARSFEELWEPRLTGDSRTLRKAMKAELARAHRIVAVLDSTRAWYGDDPELAAAVARRDEWAARVDSLRMREDDRRREITLAVAVRGRTRLAGEREAIDYHLADATYELAVQTATDPATAEDSTTLKPLRARAITRLQTFLSRYPESIARGESRFRLADLTLMQARDDFHAKMAQFLGHAPSTNDLENRALAPFVNYAPVIALYKSILADDVDFPHMDAVLFNLGMILSDDGQPDAVGYLTRLVQEYPDSPSCQEAWLRMGTDRFDRKDFAGSVAMFEQATGGSDPSLAAIALYKLGWAHFEEDRFRESADAFRRLMDLYTEHGDIAKAMDLRDEAEEYLVHSLARSGGADAFREYFDSIGGRPYESRILMSLGHLMRSHSLYEEASACDELWLARYPLDSEALDVAERLVDTYRSWNKPDAARNAKLTQAERFLPGSRWFEANTDASSRAAAQRFAQSAYRETAAYYHYQARKTDDVESWRAALANYERYLAYWPDAADSPRVHYMAGEAANRVAGYPQALAHFAAAAKTDSTALARDALWQRVAVTDTWYRSSQSAGAQRGADSLATRLIQTCQEYIDRFPDDDRSADIIWRQGNVAYAHGWYSDASTMFSMLSERFPNDPRATTAIRMTGDAHYRRAEFEAAGAAYEKALALAQAAGQDSVVTLLSKAIPLCYFKHAESVAAADSIHGEENAAPLFANVAQRWPAYEHTDLALYRAGLGFASRGSYAEGAAAWERLLAEHPNSEYARDSAVQIAGSYEKSGDRQQAARAYEHFSALYPNDPDAPTALLKAVDLLVEANDETGAHAMRSTFLSRFPGETEAVMDIRAARATRDLAKVTDGSATLSSLLVSAASGRAAGASMSDLQAYLTLAAKNPKLASAAILAQVDYLRAEESYPDYAAVKLTQPLPASIEKKKAKMEALITLYDHCADHGVAEYSRAAAHRIGTVLVEFGDALMASERPSGLGGDDLVAYNEVIEDQSWQFYNRGIDVWSKLLEQVGNTSDDPGQWLARTRQALWPRLAQRFLYQPEVDYPLVAAEPPAKQTSD
jgi:outer membrane protein assembly factor BamD (BamD/ComL family)